jgi:hypothetical protein
MGFVRVRDGYIDAEWIESIVKEPTINEEVFHIMVYTSERKYFFKSVRGNVSADIEMENLKNHIDEARG